MTRPAFRLVLLAGLTAGLFLSAGCSRRARLTHALAQANQAFTAGKYDQAEIDYLNALKLKPGNPEAISKLGILYFNEGRLGPAFAYLRKGNELQPDNLDVRLRLGLIDLATGAREKARAEAEYILNHRPKDDEAPVLLAESAGTAAEAAAATKRLQQLASVNGAPVAVALGLLQLRQHHLGEAESLFKHALALEPNLSRAYAGLNAVYSVEGKTKEAAEALHQAAEHAPPRSSFRLNYAKHLAESGDRKQARAVLEAVTKQTPDFIPAWIQLARLAADEKKYAESTSLLANVRSRDPNNPNAMMLTGQNELAEGKPDQAIATFQKMETLYPKAPEVYYRLGAAYVAKGQVDKATDNLNQAIHLAPNYPEATMMLATLQIRQGEFGRAVAALKALVQHNPNSVEAWLLLAAAYRSQGSFDDARDIYERFQKSNPKNPEVQFLLGTVLLQQQKLEDAKKAFEQALDLSPNFMPALEQIVNIDLAAGRDADARRRVENRIKAAPKDAGAHMLLARIELAAHQTQPAEDALKQAIKLQPDLPAPYELLAQTYVQSNQVQSALASLQDLAGKDPKNPTAQMLIGEIHDQQKDYPAARDAYEKALAINPDFGAALNNLAYLDAVRFNDLDKAFALAQHARELAPNDPHVADTLGWIVFKRGQYPWALTLLQEAANGMPEQPEVSYHLGMAQYMMGQASAASETLQRAVQANHPFTGVDDAKRRLAILRIDPKAATPAQEAELKKAVAGQPDDPVALAALAGIYLRQGDASKAVDALKTALKANPKNATVVMGLVRAYMALHETDQAFALAKTARQLAPDDVDALSTLGRLAYETGDCSWAASLLQQAVVKQPNDPGLLYDLALADYGTGDVSDAVTSAQQALQADAAFDRAADARRFLKLASLADDPAKALAASDEVAAALKADPKSVPALMAQGAVEEARHAPAEAAKTYEKVLTLRSGFSPAQRRLVILYSANPADDQKAAKLGPQAIQAYPQDPALARAWGMVLYRQGNFGRAADELQLAAGKNADDAELRYYLGMAQVKNNAPAEGARTLDEALKLGLKGDLAEKARTAIASTQAKGKKG